MEIQPISADSLAIFDRADISQTTQVTNQSDFVGFVSDSLANVNQSIVDSNQAIEDLALGKVESTHEVIIAMEEAKMSLQLAVEVRNKLVEAYQEILRMQV